MPAKKIMVVDNDQATTDFLKTLLEMRGYDVVPTYSGQECIEELKAEKPDAILLDIMMSEISGWDVLETLEKDENTKDIPVIVVTVKGNPRDISLATERYKVNSYIVKPFRNEELLGEIDKCLSDV